MTSDLIDFNVFITKNRDAPCLLKDDEVKLLLDNINDVNDDQLENMYQIHGITGTKKACIKHIGKCGNRPGINIGEMDFKNHKCRLVSYLLTDIDLEEANKNCYMNIISLHIIKDNLTVGIISLEFHTFQHVVAGKNIKDLLNIEIEGFFEFFFKTIDADTEYINKRNIGSLENFPKKTNLVYTLLKLLSHKDVKYIFK